MSSTDFLTSPATSSAPLRVGGRKASSPRARVMRHVEELIASGVISQGQRLPSERDLAQELNVARRTVNAALSEMIKNGTLHSNGGKLRYVTPQNSHSSAGEGDESQWLRDAIIIVAPDVRASPPHQMHGWTQFLTQSAFHMSQEHGHAVLLSSLKLSRERFEHILASRPQGVLVMDGVAESEWENGTLSGLSQSGVPTVIYGNSPHAREFDRVASDHEAGSYELTRWMLARGCKRILHVWPAPAHNYWFVARRRGYERALREVGIEPLPDLLIPPLNLDEPMPSTQASFEDQVRHCIGYLAQHLTGANPCDAILAASDGETFRLLAACRLLGREPNRDVLVAGYDNYWGDAPEREWEKECPIVTVDKYNDLLGAEMVRLLFERVQGALPPEAQLRYVKPQLLPT